MAVDNKKRASKKPTHSLEGLDVREVSIVDRPANQQRFLIVKRDDQTGDLNISLTEAEKMARSAVAASEAQPATVIEIEGIDKLDPLGILDVVDETQTSDDPPADDAADDGDEEETAATDADASDDDADDDEGETPVTKVAVLKVMNGSLSSLMVVVNTISKADGALTEDQAGTLQDIAKALAADADAVEVEDVRKDLTGALSKLMSTVNVVKALDEAIDELPDAITTSMAEVSATLKGAAASIETKTEPETDQPQEPAPDQLVVYKSTLPDGDLDLIIKRGAKMKTTRLSTLRRAVTMLSELIKDLEGGDAKSGDKTKTKTTKADGDDTPETIDAESIAAQVIASVNASLVKVATEVNGSLNKLREDVDAIGKRVDEADGTVPDGNASGEEEEETTPDGNPVKKAENIWNGIV